MFRGGSSGLPANEGISTVLSRSSLRSRLAGIRSSESGAFDLPSILVGVVVVGILTAGVLASVFGVIPFAQDLGAKQDLGSIRIAQSVSKVNTGKFTDSAGLAAAQLISSPKAPAVKTNAAGSCYVGISRSATGTLFYATDQITDPLPLLADSTPGCLAATEVNALVTVAGGTPFAAAADPQTAICGGATYKVSAGATLTCEFVSTAGLTSNFKLTVTGTAPADAPAKWAVTADWSGVAKFQNGKAYGTGVADTGAITQQTGYQIVGMANGSTDPKQSWNHAYVSTAKAAEVFTVQVNVLS
jgi:type II secretory pathway pseudopilin PulG